LGIFPDVVFFIEERDVVFAFWKAAFQELTQASEGGVIETRRFHKLSLRERFNP
jgi:hypothetical protein